MLGTLLAAVLIVLSSVVIGRALMLAMGWKRPEWVAGAVGFAALVVVAPFLVRLPGRGLTAAVILGRRRDRVRGRDAPGDAPASPR